MQEFITLQGFKVWTAKEGQGNPILFCHGGPGLWDYLEPVSDMLANQAEVLRYEQRGCGRSGGSAPYTVAAHVEDIELLRKHWGIEKLTIVGHSWGANLAMAYALRYPESVKSVVYLCGTGITNDWNAEFKQTWSERLTEGQRERVSELEERLKDTSSEDWNQVDTEYCRLAWSPDFSDRSTALDFSSRLLSQGFHPNYEVNDLVWSDWKRYVQQPGLAGAVKGMVIPFLVLAGADDPRPAKYLREFAGSLQKGNYVEISGAGHYPWLEDYDSVAAALRGFLAKNP